MSSPLQNRVLPTGEIVADHARGLFMGNRGGRLHTGDQTLGRARWKSKQWIICLLDFKGRKRRVMGDGYTELFFVDEVTAIAAGHRPCFECQRQRALAFAQAFPGEGRVRATDMDRVLHVERRGSNRRDTATTLPDGAMFLWNGSAWAKRGADMLRWSSNGYEAREPMADETVDVLTPRSTCTALAAGYAPIWHPSAA